MKADDSDLLIIYLHHLFDPNQLEINSKIFHIILLIQVATMGIIFISTVFH
jgi:hypothetical protein